MSPMPLRHNRTGIRAAIAAVMLLVAVACDTPNPGGPKPEQLSTTTSVSANVGQSVIEEDVVVQLDTAHTDAPVKVAFGHHAAIYMLDRGDPNFAPWLAILQRSLAEGTRVRFSYAVAGQRLTLVESAP